MVKLTVFPVWKITNGNFARRKTAGLCMGAASSICVRSLMLQQQKVDRYPPCTEQRRLIQTHFALTFACLFQSSIYFAESHWKNDSKGKNNFQIILNFIWNSFFDLSLKKKRKQNHLENLIIKKLKQVKF